MRAVLALLLLAAPEPARADDAGDLKEQVSQVIDFFYDLQFDKAREAADAIASRHQGHPAGPFLRSLVSYQRWISEGKNSEAAIASFDKDSREAVEAAEAMLPSAEGHYYLGAARGFRARTFAGRHKYLRSLPEATSAIKHLREAVSLDPTLEEAYLGIGMYHYYAANIPAGAKPFSFLITGIWGSRRKGLAELERAAEKGGPARMEAKSVLSVIYTTEKEAKWDKAEEILAELTARYPHNPLYRFRRVYAAERRGAWDQALLLADPNGAWLGRLESSLQGVARAHARYRAVEAMVLSGKAEGAGDLLDALEAAPVPPELKDWIVLRRANYLHALGRADEAEAQYMRLRDPEAAVLGRSFRRQPFERGSRGVRPMRTRDTPY